MQLKKLYPNDDDFQYHFVRKTISSRQYNGRIKLLLRKIERHSSGGKEPSANLTIEHILPYVPRDKWQEYFGRPDVPEAIDRLGNFALLEKSKNTGHEPFSHKREVLRKSGYAINTHIAEYEEWNMNMLNEHQAWLAKQASALWRISPFD